MEVYRVEGDAEQVAAELRNRLAGRPGVRIASHGASGQLLVIGADDVHAQVARWLASPAESADRQPPPAPSATATPVAGRDSRIVPLHALDAAELGRALRTTFGDRLRGQPGASVFALSLPAGELSVQVLEQTGRVALTGPAASVEAMARLIAAIDRRDSADRATRVVALHQSRPGVLRPAVDALAQADVPAAGTAGGRPSDPPAQTSPAVDGDGATGGPLGPVQIESLDGLGVLVIRGKQADVEQILRVIDQIEQLSAETEPEVRVLALAHVDSAALAELVQTLYADVLAARQGAVSITALAKPNALLLAGRPENVASVAELVARLDRPVAPESQFRVFRLRHAPAESARAMLEQFFAERGTLGTRCRVTADFRANSLVVQAAPRDLAEIEALIARIDTPTSEAVNELRVVKLHNSLAAELAPVLQSAIAGQPPPGAAAGGDGASGAAQTAAQSMMLRFLTVDTAGQRILRSGILTGVRVTADARANTLLVSAPAESMELLEALIRELDGLPAAESQVKVFTIINSDAVSLVEMLQSLFGTAARGGEPPVHAAPVEGESTLVPLRFAVDARTNSIIATGTAGMLGVVEAILLRLDDEEALHRRSQVYRLKNAPANDVATAVNEFLRSEREVQDLTPGAVSPFEQIEREVIVVPEPVSNSLIVSATPRFFDEIQQLVEQLDERPPMVMIQVLIAEVALNDADEFGVELGLQDSILFDRSVLGDISTISQTVFNQFGNPVAQEQVIVSATNQPGFQFNSPQIGNSGSASSLATRENLGGQALSNFGVGRINNELGFGGLVLSASNESINFLLRALKEDRRLQVLSRPQIMTLDNQPAYIQVGERVPRITSAQISETGTVNSVTLTNVGLILGVTPRISPDGMVVMEVDAERSAVGPIEDGIPVSIAANGEAVKSPRIEVTTAQTTVIALSGQTLVLGGLISTAEREVHRRVPGLSNVPVVGHLFRFDSKIKERSELLIIMTPHIVESREDADRIKQIEAARMNWCLCDAVELHGDFGVRPRSGEWKDCETMVVFPDLQPGLEPLAAPPLDLPETLPTPVGEPMEKAARGTPKAALPHMPPRELPTP